MPLAKTFKSTGRHRRASKWQVRTIEYRRPAVTQTAGLGGGGWRRRDGRSPRSLDAADGRLNCNLAACRPMTPSAARIAPAMQTRSWDYAIAVIARVSLCLLISNVGSWSIPEEDFRDGIFS